MWLMMRLIWTFKCYIQHKKFACSPEFSAVYCKYFMDGWLPAKHIMSLFVISNFWDKLKMGVSTLTTVDYMMNDQIKGLFYILFIFHFLYYYFSYFLDFLKMMIAYNGRINRFHYILIRYVYRVTIKLEIVSSCF